MLDEGYLKLMDSALKPTFKAYQDATKTWHVRNLAVSRHPHMNGETVGIGEKFSNGLMYPGAFGHVDESAGCHCWMTTNLPEMQSADESMKRITLWEILQFILGLKTIEEVVGEKTTTKHWGPTLGDHYHPHIGPFDDHGSLITWVDEMGQLFTGKPGSYVLAQGGKKVKVNKVKPGPSKPLVIPQIDKFDEAAVASMKENFDAKALSSDEEDAIASYMGNGYAHINGPLRDKTVENSQLVPEIFYLDKAMEHGTLQEDLVVWRGFGTGRGLKLHEDMEFIDDGFTSVSWRKYQAEQFAGITQKPDGTETGNMIKLVLPKGSHYAIGSDSEDEMILPRGNHYKVIDYTEDDSEQGGYWTIELQHAAELLVKNQKDNNKTEVAPVEVKGFQDVPKPMLLTETRDAFNNPDYIYQKKYDGQRALIRISDGKVEIRSRTLQDITDKFPQFQDLGHQLKLDPNKSYILDGEIAAFDELGRTDIDMLQTTRKKDGSGDKVAVKFVAFDILESTGEDITGRPLEDRLSLLHQVMPEEDSPLIMETPSSTNGVDLFEEVRTRGEEGIVAKKRGSTYTTGSRSKDWIKVKFYKQAELVVVGWEEGKGERAGHIGAVQLGAYRSDGTIRYVGSIGSGISGETLDRMEVLVRGTEASDPTDGHHKMPGTIHFVKPKTVLTIEFTDLTDKQLLRQPKLITIRDDKAAQDATMESLLNVANPPILEQTTDASPAPVENMNKMNELGDALNLALEYDSGWKATSRTSISLAGEMGDLYLHFDYQSQKWEMLEGAKVVGKYDTAIEAVKDTYFHPEPKMSIEEISQLTTERAMTEISDEIKRESAKTDFLDSINDERVRYLNDLFGEEQTRKSLGDWFDNSYDQNGFTGKIDKEYIIQSTRDWLIDESDYPSIPEFLVERVVALAEAEAEDKRSGQESGDVEELLADVSAQRQDLSNKGREILTETLLRYRTFNGVEELGDRLDYIDVNTAPIITRPEWAGDAPADPLSMKWRGSNLAVRTWRSPSADKITMNQFPSEADRMRSWTHTPAELEYLQDVVIKDTGLPTKWSGKVILGSKNKEKHHGNDYWGLKYASCEIGLAFSLLSFPRPKVTIEKVLIHEMAHAVSVKGELDYGGNSGANKGYEEGVVELFAQAETRKLNPGIPERDMQATYWEYTHALQEARDIWLEWKLNNTENGLSDDEYTDLLTTGYWAVLLSIPLNQREDFINAQLEDAGSYLRIRANMARGNLELVDPKKAHPEWDETEKPSSPWSLSHVGLRTQLEKWTPEYINATKLKKAYDTWPPSKQRWFVEVLRCVKKRRDSMNAPEGWMYDLLNRARSAGIDF